MISSTNSPRSLNQNTDPSPHGPTNSSDAHGYRGRFWSDWFRPEHVGTTVLIADICIIIVTSCISGWAYQWATIGALANVASAASLGALVAVNFVAMMAARHNFRVTQLIMFRRQIREATIIWFSIIGMLATVGFTMKISSDFSRGSAILFLSLGLATILMWRFSVTRFLVKALQDGSFSTKNVIVIAELDQESSSRSLAELRRYGYRPAKTCLLSKDEIRAVKLSRSLRAKLADVIDFARKEEIDEIYLSISWSDHHAIDAILGELAVLPVSVHLVPDESTSRFFNNPIANVGNAWTAELRRTPLTSAERAAKRLFDFTVAGFALVSLALLILIAALMVKLDSPGPVLFRQKRHGFNGRPFDIFKFRTMRVLEDGAGIQQAMRDDPRVTRVGRLLRRSSIDELPQLLNVLRGDMSLVGPRPHALDHNSKYEKLIANYAFRHHVVPGLTGWAQVNGFRGETRQLDQMRHRVEYDLWYINNWSPLLDVKILLKTVFVLLGQTNAY